MSHNIHRIEYPGLMHSRTRNFYHIQWTQSWILLEACMWWYEVHIDGLMQEIFNSSALGMEYVFLALTHPYERYCSSFEHGYFLLFSDIDRI